MFPAYAQPSIKVALLERLIDQGYPSLSYARDYMRGVRTALEAIAQQQGIVLRLKHFGYGKDYLAILDSVDEVKRWQPDLIIGPRTSNEFLLLAPYFSHSLVVSPAATAKRVYTMPDNFYSMSMPDSYNAPVIAKFAQRRFPNPPSVIILDEVDCLSCHEVATLIDEYYQKHFPKLPRKRQRFVAAQVQQISMGKLLQSWQPGSLIFLPTTAQVSEVLMATIANYLAKTQVIFIGGDAWVKHKPLFVDSDAWHLDRTALADIPKTIYPYVGYHLEDWSLTNADMDIATFKHFYRKLYPGSNMVPISYAAFHVLYSVVSVLDAKQLQAHKSPATYIRDTFVKYVKQHQHAFRQKYYVAYQWNQQHNTNSIVAVLPVRGADAH